MIFFFFFFWNLRLSALLLRSSLLHLSAPAASSQPLLRSRFAEAKEAKERRPKKRKASKRSKILEPDLERKI
jgi:hypothetical protein